jgi:hypothetical protein
MRLLGLFAVACSAGKISLLFRNLDGQHNAGIYFKPEKEMEKLQHILEPRDGGIDGDRYRLVGYSGHEFVVRSSDLKFRSAVSVIENEDYTDDQDGHKFKITFTNLMGDEQSGNMEINSNGFIWIDQGMSHQFFSNVNHEFIIRNQDKEEKVGVTILAVEADDEL